MKKIEALLSHREPFLFLDDVDVDGDEIVGYRTFKPSESFFRGHFPGHPIVPGVILVETMAQCGGAGLRLGGTSKSSNFVLIKIEDARFHKSVRPGDTVRMVVQNETVTGTLINQSGKAYVKNTLVAKAEWICVAGDK